MSNIAPFKLNLSQGVTVGGVALDLSVYCGQDWLITVPFYAADGVTPVNVSSPLMQIRAAADRTSALICTPTLTANANAITISIPGSASKLIGYGSGAYDLHATRADTGGPLWLMFGHVTFNQSTTAL